MMDIEQYLRDNRPGMPEEGQFLIETNMRLDKVEGIKKCVDEDRHRGRTALIVATMGGFALGCIATLLARFYPLPPIAADMSFLARVVEFLQEWEEVFIVLIAGCALSLGLLCITRPEEVL